MRFLASIVVCLLAVQSLYSLDIVLNSQVHRNWSDAALEEHSYPVPPTAKMGISLGEVLPLMISSYTLEIVHSGGTTEIGLPRGAEHFFLLYLVRSSMGWELISEDPSLVIPRLAGISTLRVYGEALRERDLTCWISWEGTRELKEEIGRFEDLHGLELNVQEVPKISSKLISVLRGGGEVPDLIMTSGADIHTLTNAGALQNLDYMVPLNAMKKGVNSFTLDGRVWALPFYFDSQLIFYRSDLLPRAKLPGSFSQYSWDLDQFEGVLRYLRNRSIEPISWNVYSAYWLIPFQMGFGKDHLIDRDGGLTITDGPTKLALEYIISLQERGLLSERERDGMVSSFISGDVGMMLSGSYSIPQFEKIGLPFGVLPYPYNQKTGKYISPMLDFKGFAITKRTKRPILARRLIQYLTGIGVQQRFPPALAKLPVHPGAWEIAKRANPYHEVLARSMEIGTSVPPEKAYGIYKNTMWKLLRFVLTGQMGIDRVLKEGQSIINAKLR